MEIIFTQIIVTVSSRDAIRAGTEPKGITYAIQFDVIQKTIRHCEMHCRRRRSQADAIIIVKRETSRQQISFPSSIAYLYVIIEN